jgi:hypothetical protein
MHSQTNEQVFRGIFVGNNSEFVQTFSPISFGELQYFSTSDVPRLVRTLSLSPQDAKHDYGFNCYDRFFFSEMCNQYPLTKDAAHFAMDQIADDIADPDYDFPICGCETQCDASERVWFSVSKHLRSYIGSGRWIFSKGLPRGDVSIFEACAIMYGIREESLDELWNLNVPIESAYTSEEFNHSEWQIVRKPARGCKQLFNSAAYDQINRFEILGTDNDESVVDLKTGRHCTQRIRNIMRAPWPKTLPSMYRYEADPTTMFQYKSLDLKPKIMEFTQSGTEPRNKRKPKEKLEPIDLAYLRRLREQLVTVIRFVRLIVTLKWKELRF